RKVVPAVAVLRVVLAHGAPLALREVSAPALPILLASSVLRQARRLRVIEVVRQLALGRKFRRMIVSHGRLRRRERGPVTRARGLPKKYSPSVTAARRRRSAGQEMRTMRDYFSEQSVTADTLPVCPI